MSCLVGACTTPGGKNRMGRTGKNPPAFTKGEWFMKTQCKTLGLVLAILIALPLVGLGIAQAQNFPSKPVNLFIPFGAGGSHDLTARALASVAYQYLGQPLVIQLKPGGGGAIASDFVAQAPPDGYTLLFGGTGPNSVLPAIEGRSKGPNDLLAVCRVNYSAPVIVTRPGLPYKTFKEMIAWAKANPGKLVFGNSGPWGASDTPWKMIMKETGIKTKIVPFGGGGPQLIAILGGHLDVAMIFTAQGMPHIQAGKLIPLAVLDDKRDPDLKNVPTVKEEGVNVVFTMWRAVLAPKKTPRPIIDKLAADFKKITEDKSAVNMIKKLGDEVEYLGPDAFTKVWKEEYGYYKELGKAFKK
jgi:tripartite-type tricarboxylate transporter receptor subunit TctC